MSWPSRFAARCRGLFARARRERELDDEFRSHLEMQIDENLARGMDPASARLAALRSFGGATRAKEAYRDARSFPVVETLAQDVRYALRGMRNNPVFTAVAVLSLALGIGANTAIFNLIDAVLLRSLPVRDPQSLLRLTAFRGPGESVEGFSYPMVHALAGRREIFSGLAGFYLTTFKTSLRGGEEQTSAAWVTGEYYQTLGLEPSAGRLLTPDDDRPGAAPVAVLSDGYWARRFARDPRVVGKTIRLGSADAVVIGVSRPGFSGLDVGRVAEITIAASSLPQVDPAMGALLLQPNYFYLHVAARPRPGLSTAQAQRRLDAVWPAIADASPIGKRVLTQPVLQSASTGWSDLRRQFRRPLLVLMVVVALVLLIACANVANLSLARAGARQREIALRLAIGASRARLVRQMFTESLLLSLCGAALGMGLAWFGGRFLVDVLRSGPADQTVIDLALHRHVLLFTTLVAVSTAVLFGVVPALRTTRAGLAMSLKSSPAQSGGTQPRLSSALVVFQVALSLLLLIGAGLFLGTLRNLRHFDAGFRHEGVLFVDITGESRPYRYQDLMDTIGRLPGIVSVSVSNSTIFSGGGVLYEITVPGRSSAPEEFDFDRIGPRYFETLRTPVLEGREFTPRDDKAAPRVAVVNQAFARHFFPEGHAVGREVVIEGDRTPVQIVGVVKDTRSQNLREPAQGAVYVPFFQRETPWGTVEVHAAGSLAQVVAELRREIQPLTGGTIRIRPLTAQVERTLVQERLVATLAASFGALALIMACIGLYGLLAYTVTRRTREIGIRMALGAERARVLRLMLRHAVHLLIFGIALGLPAAWLASRWIATLLFGLTPTDPATILLAAAVLSAFALLAGFLPALRASRVDPTVALRYE